MHISYSEYHIPGICTSATRIHRKSQKRQKKERRKKSRFVSKNKETNTPKNNTSTNRKENPKSGRTLPGSPSLRQDGHVKEAEVPLWNIATPHVTLQYLGDSGIRTSIIATLPPATPGNEKGKWTALRSTFSAVVVCSTMKNQHRQWTPLSPKFSTIIPVYDTSKDVTDRGAMFPVAFGTRVGFCIDPVDLPCFLFV